MPIITLISDYGTRDHYVAALKGVILSIAPEARIVDITHEVEPQNIAHAAFVLRQCWSWYPAATIHLAIVDPGVGSSRRIVLGRYAGQFVVAPDNGLVSFVHHDFPLEGMRVVEERRYFLTQVSNTFHGRDIMAPVSAHLAQGVKPREFGRATDHVEVLPLNYSAAFVGNTVLGQVLYVDHFGTLVTNIHRDQLAMVPGASGRMEVEVNGTPIGPLRSTFSDVAAGEPAALIGGSELLEVAVNRGSAVQRFGPAETARVEVRIANSA